MWMRFKNVVKTMIFSLLPLAIIVTCIEVSLSLVGVGQPFRKASNFWDGGLQMMMPDVYSGYRPKPYFSDHMLNLNSFGLRDNELDRNAHIKILALGDSCTFGWKVNTADMTYPALLERKLNRLMESSKNRVTVDVMNAGVPSYTVYQGFQFYMKYLEPITKWDFVLVSYGWNETPGEELDIEFVLRNPPVENRVLSMLRDYAKRLRFYNLLESAWYQVRIGAVSDPYLLVAEQYKNNYLHLVKAIQRTGAKAVLSAVIIHPEDLTPKAERMKKLNSIAREIAEQEGATWLDLNALFKSRNELLWWYDEYHYDHNGDEQVASSLALTLHKLIDTPP